MVEFGPALRKVLENTQALAQQSVEVSIDDPEAAVRAYQLEYGVSGEVETAFLRAALLRIGPEVKELLHSGGIEAVRERMEQLARDSAQDHISDPILAEKIGNAVQARIVD